MKYRDCVESTKGLYRVYVGVRRDCTDSGESGCLYSVSNLWGHKVESCQS